MKSVYGFSYSTKLTEILDFKILNLNDLDENIDRLCSYFGEQNQDKSLNEEYCPYFGVLWEAGIGLSQHLTKEMCEEKSIIELGCGLALPSFVASQFKGNVTATDFHEDVPKFLQINQIQNNQIFSYKKADWRLQNLGQFDIVMGSDVLYESQHPREVVKALVGHLNPGGKIILADPGRAYIQKFVTAMNEEGFKEELSIQTIRAEWTQKKANKEVYIFEFTSQF